MQDIGWSFRDSTLRDAASAGDGVAFQRLELLGDAVADAILLPWLYTWSTGTVAVLAGARQQLTSDTTLDHLSVLTGLHGVLPPNHRGSADHRADLVEAVIGAAFLDGGWEAATTVCETVFGTWLTEPAGVADKAARIDTVVSRHRGRWRWRSLVWTSGTADPHLSTAHEDDPLRAELAALTSGVLHLGRTRPTVWLEISDELRAEMRDGAGSPVAGPIRELRALLAGFDGVWFVPSARIDTTLDPWAPELEPDGVITPFEATLGHDLVRPALERLALHPGEEQRRLGFVGIGVLKSASAIRAFHRHPSRSVGHLHESVHAELAVDRLQRAAFAVGLVDLLFPGARPADPVALVRAALGATAVDAGAAQAVDLATEWLEQLRVDDTDLAHLSAIDASFGGEPGEARHVDVSLVTPDGESHWRLGDDGVGLHALALEGICAALDCIEPPHDRHPILVAAPAGVMRAVDAGGDPTRDRPLADAVGRFLGRVDQRGLQVVWHGPVHGGSRQAT